jgi:hypothetical protein
MDRRTGGGKSTGDIHVLSIGSGFLRDGRVIFQRRLSADLLYASQARTAIYATG